MRSSRAFACLAVLACVLAAQPGPGNVRTGPQLASFHSGVKRFVNPHRYPVGLERGLQDLKLRLILEARRAPV